MRFQNRAGLLFWHNAALVTFAAVAIGMTWTVMNSGFSSSEVMKDVIEDAVTDSANAFQVVGSMTGTAQVAANEVMVTATPITTTINGIVDLDTSNIKIAYKIIKDASYTVTQENIYAGTLYGTSYNSVGSAIKAAKEQGLISTNPLVDEQKPQETVAFLYWIINLDGDEYLQNGEIMNLVIIYSEKDRPSTGEYLQIQATEKQGILLDIQRTVPNISTSILDFGGKVKND